MELAASDIGAGDAPSEDACFGSEGAKPERSLIDSVTVEMPDGASVARTSERTPQLTAFQRRIREQLGLPTDRPVIMSGHQAEVWHPGILAKWLAGAALAKRVGGVFVWLHVDQDTNEPGVIEVPAFDSAGTLVRRTLTLLEPMRDVPTGARPARRIDAGAARLQPGEGLVDTPSVERLIDGLNGCAIAPTLALQFAGATRALLGELGGSEPNVVSITTSDLAATDGFRVLVEEMGRDAASAIEHHNLAVAQVPEAGMRALGLKRAASTDQTLRAELPLWRVQPGQVRTPVMLSHLASIPIAELRPRALLMTGLARLGACDLFVHGTGGGVYDRITEAWFEGWLGPTELAESLPLAPLAVVSATARLAFGSSHGGVSVRDARSARHRAHHARHNPGLLEDEGAARAKRSLVEQIAGSSDRAERALLFRQMQDLLGEVRAAHSVRLQEMDASASDADRRAREESIVRTRTWPFAIYDERTLFELRERIEGAIDA